MAHRQAKALADVGRGFRADVVNALRDAEVELVQRVLGVGEAALRQGGQAVRAGVGGQGHGVNAAVDVGVGRVARAGEEGTGAAGCGEVLHALERGRHQRVDFTGQVQVRGVGFERTGVESVVDNGLHAVERTGERAHGAGVSGELAGGGLAGNGIGAAGVAGDIGVQVIRRGAIAVEVRAQGADGFVHRGGGRGGAGNPQLHGGAVDLGGGEGERGGGGAGGDDGQGDLSKFHDKIPSG